MELTTYPLDIESFPHLTEEPCARAWKRFIVDENGLHGPFFTRPLPFFQETGLTYRVLFPIQTQPIKLTSVGETPYGVELGGHFYLAYEDAIFIPYNGNGLAITTPVAIPLSEIQLVGETSLIAKSCFTLTTHLPFHERMKKASSNHRHDLQVERIIPQKKDGKWRISRLRDEKSIPIWTDNFLSKRRFLSHLRKFIFSKDISPGRVGISPFPSSQMILHKRGSGEPLFLLTLV